MTQKSKKRPLYTRCCDGIATADELHEMTGQGREISYATFIKHADVSEFIEQHGYARNCKKGLTLQKDWAVRFHRSKFKGQVCYYMDWSAIEHIFLYPNQIALLK